MKEKSEGEILLLYISPVIENLPFFLDVIASFFACSALCGSSMASASMVEFPREALTLAVKRSKLKPEASLPDIERM